MKDVNILINNFIHCLQVMPLTNYIGIEGLPYSGKSTFASNYIKKKSLNKFIIIPEHMIFIKRSGIPISKNWISKYYEQNLNRQKKFIDIDIKRCTNIKKYLKVNKNIILDRTIISPFVYLLTRIINNPANLILGDPFLKYLHRRIIEKKILLPKQIFYLNTRPEICLKRAKESIKHGNTKGTERFLLLINNLRIMESFYISILNNLESDIGIKIKYIKEEH